jgi:hypothetical protein
MSRYQRVDGQYLGDCQCGCGLPLHERLYLRPTGSIAFRSRPRYARHHSLRVNRCDRTGATNYYPVAEARKALILPLGGELDATIQRRRRELRLSTDEMLALLGWKGRSNLHRYKAKPNLMQATLRAVLDKLFANEGGWVEAGPLWMLVRDRQVLWGMTDEEMAACLGTTEVRWIGLATARSILLTLAGPRRPSAWESEWAQRQVWRKEKAQERAQERAQEQVEDSDRQAS